MTNTKTLVLLLPLLTLACSLTAQVAPLPQNERGAALAHHEQIMPTHAPTRHNQPCQVKTGIDAGRLNLRTCGGLDCPVLAVIHEGELLTITQTVNGWLAVETAGSLRGWVNSDYCEVKK